MMMLMTVSSPRFFVVDCRRFSDDTNCGNTVSLNHANIAIRMVVVVVVNLIYFYVIFIV